MRVVKKKRRWPRCPECQQLLDPLRRGEIEIDRCRRCGGLWFERNELRWVLRDGDDTGVVNRLLPQREPGDGMPTALRCTDCGASLRSHALIGAELEIAQCEQCHGVWLTKGTLEHLETIRDGEAALAQYDKPADRRSWMMQFLSGMPIEFNMRPRRAAIVTYLLVVANCLAFGLEVCYGLGGSNESGLELGPFALVAAEFPRGSWWLALFAHQFLHGGLMHLAGNMYFLWVLGDNVEDMLGWWRYLLFYLACGAVGGLAQTLADPSSTVPMVGASGAIAGIAAAYTLLFRRASLTMMVFVWQWKVSVLWYWGIWVAFNVLGAGLGIFGVGWFAHLGGFATGLVVTAFAHQRILAANPVLQYVREGATLARRFQRLTRRRRPA